MPKLKLNSSTTNQILPWLCFNIPTTSDPSTTNDVNGKKSSSSSTMKLIMSNGQVKTYDHPVRASDLMSEFPSHLVCHSDSFLVGQKVPSLDPSDNLDLGNSYFLLPSSFFLSTLSLVSIASSFSPSDRAALLKMVEVQRTHSGKLRISVSIDDFVERIDASGSSRGRVCTTMELEREYRGMVRRRGEGWKPKLEAIKEIKEGRNKDKKNTTTKVMKKKAKFKHLQLDDHTQSTHSNHNTINKEEEEEKKEEKKTRKMIKKLKKYKDDFKSSSEDNRLQEDGQVVDNCGSIPPPPPPPPSPAPPRRPFGAIMAKRKDKKKQMEKKR